MSALLDMTTVMLMQCAVTQMAILCAPVWMDMRAMGLPASVSSLYFQRPCFLSQITSTKSLQTLDIDECLMDQDNCHTNATCSDTNGSYQCFCLSGYTGDGVNCTSKHTLFLLL